MFVNLANLHMLFGGGAATNSNKLLRNNLVAVACKRQELIYISAVSLCPRRVAGESAGRDSAGTKRTGALRRGFGSFAEKFARQLVGRRTMRVGRSAARSQQRQL